MLWQSGRNPKSVGEFRYDRSKLSKVTGMRGGCRSGSVRYALLGPLAGVSGGACPAEVSSLRLLSFDMGGFKSRNEE